MKWLPKKTHEWNKFIKPEELCNYIEQSNLKVIDKRGFVFNFLKWNLNLKNIFKFQIKNLYLIYLNLIKKVRNIICGGF